MSIPVAAWIRVSTGQQAGEDRAGIPRQQAGIKVAVERHGLRVATTFTLEGVSGSVTASTQEWADVRRLLASGSIRGVVVDAVDRLCRASDLDLGVLSDLQRHGATIYTPTEVRSLSSSSDGLIAGILALVAGQERREISRRMEGGREAKRRAGKWASDPARLPPGIAFDKASGTWSLVEPEISEMREIYRRIGSRESSTHAIGIELGIPSKTLRQRLEHPLYRGWLVSAKRSIYDPLTKKKTVVDREDVIRVQVFDEPPISIALTDAVDARLASNRRVYKTRHTIADDDTHHFRGLLICMGCGGGLSTLRRSRAFMYGCSARGCPVGEMKLEEVHHALICTAGLWASQRGFFEKAIITAMKEAQGETADDPRPKLKGRLSALSERRERLVDLFLSGLVSKDEVERRKPLLDRQIDAAEKELQALEGDASRWLDRLFERVRDAAGAFDDIIAALPLGKFASSGDGGEDLDRLLADEDHRAAMVAQALRAMGGKVGMFRDRGIGKAVEVRALQLDPRRVAALIEARHETAPSPL